jgi:uncharacterized cupin superfamily protein
MPEAQIRQTAEGAQAEGPGWFVVNLDGARAVQAPPFGIGVRFEAEDDPFPDFGINVRVLRPGEPNCLYHAESPQEAFLVLHGECLLVIEEQERSLRQWDFVHCPPSTPHVFVGAGDGPCAILMVGARSDDERLLYPASELARRHGAGAERETTSPEEAYRSFSPPVERRPDGWDELPWA